MHPPDFFRTVSLCSTPLLKAGDADLAGFYGVATNRLNEQVKRNANRFPGDFMLTCPPLRHLAAAGVSRAEKQKLKFPIHNSSEKREFSFEMVAIVRRFQNPTCGFFRAPPISMSGYTCIILLVTK